MTVAYHNLTPEEGVLKYKLINHDSFNKSQQLAINITSMTNIRCCEYITKTSGD
jgi:hypothetical protein